MIAQGVHTGNLDDFVEGATHYHATYVLPEWAESKSACRADRRTHILSLGLVLDYEY